MTSPDSMLKLQRQIRENATELQDYLHDLDAWEDEIKKKDKTFTQMKPNTEVKRIPLPRSATTTKKKTTVEQKQTIKPKKLKSYDYRSWDKLDVDKMLEDMDVEEERERKESQEQMAQDLKELAVKEKNKGNEHLKHERYDKAVECYTKGMQFDPSNPVLPANRALAFLKLERYVETEADCTLSLSLDPAYIKAYLRRGSARKAMTKIEGATRDFRDVLKLEPDNRQAKNELDKIENMGKQSATKSSPGRAFSSIGKGPLVLPIIKPPNKRSKKPLRRIQVEEIGNKIEEIESTKLTTLSSEAVSSKFLASSNKDAELGEKNVKHRIAEVVTTNGTSSGDSFIHSEEIAVPPVPNTFYQFQADVRKTKNHRSVLMKYIMQITPQLFPKLIKEQLETSLFSAILAAMVENVTGNEAFVIEFLESFTKIKRFEMAVMFLSESEKQDLTKIFTALMNTSSTIDIGSLAKKFSVSAGLS